MLWLTPVSISRPEIRTAQSGFWEVFPLDLDIRLILAIHDVNLHVGFVIMSDKYAGRNQVDIFLLICLVNKENLVVSLMISIYYENLRPARPVSKLSTTLGEADCLGL